jgi:hypothetical protein
LLKPHRITSATRIVPKAAALTVCLWLAACGAVGQAPGDAGADGASPVVDSGSAPLIESGSAIAPLEGGAAFMPDASGCAPVPASTLPSGASPATGTIDGPNLHAVVCPGGVWARVESAGALYDTAPYFLILGYAIGENMAAPVDFDFSSPVGANSGELDLMTGLSAPSPGVYTSPSGQDCGGSAFTYYLPLPPGIDCDGGTDVSCPNGCGRACPVSGCQGIPCEPQPPSLSFVGAGSTDCIGDMQAPQGTWTLNLTSVTPASGSGSSLEYYTPHGTLQASLPADDAGTGAADLAISF